MSVPCLTLKRSFSNKAQRHAIASTSPTVGLGQRIPRNLRPSTRDRLLRAEEMSGPATVSGPTAQTIRKKIRVPELLRGSACAVGERNDSRSRKCPGSLGPTNVLRTRPPGRARQAARAADFFIHTADQQCNNSRHKQMKVHLL